MSFLTRTLSNWRQRAAAFPSETIPLRRLFARAAIFGALLLTTVRLPADIGVGDPFPELAAAGLSGRVPETHGQVVLVDFWASWCAPCKASFPAFAKLNSDYAPRGLVILAVSVDEKPAAYSNFVQKWQPPFAVVRDASQKLVSTVKVPSMPTSYLLGRDGRVRFLHRGFHGSATEQELRQHIEAVLAEKQ